MSFPLMKLPQSAVLNVLKQLDMPEFLAFSLQSSRSHHLAVLIHWRTFRLRIRFAEHVHIHVLLSLEEDGLGLHISGTRAPNLIQSPPFVVITSRSQSESVWERQNKTVRQWLEHLSQIFHAKSLELSIHANEFGKHDIEMLVQGFRISSLSFRDTVIFPYLIALDSGFTLAKNTYKIPDLQKMLIQNLNSTSFSNSDRITMDALLVNNSKNLSFSILALSLQNFGKFLKFWKRGSNPRLEKLNLYSGLRNVAVEESDRVLRGIGAQLVPKEAWINVNFGDIIIDHVEKVWRINKRRDNGYADVFIMKVHMQYVLSMIVNR